MIHSAPTITKEQYESLARLGDKKEFDLNIEGNHHVFGDRLNAFLKEHRGEVSSNNAKSDVNFYKLFEMVA